MVVRDSIVSPELGTQANPIVIGDDLAPLGSASNPIVIYVGECSCRNGTDQVGFDADTEIMTTLECWETLIDGDFTVPADEGEAVVHPPIRSLVREDPEDLQSSEQSSPDFSLLDDKALKATESSFYRLQNCSGLEAPSSGNTRNGHKVRLADDYLSMLYQRFLESEPSMEKGKVFKAKEARSTPEISSMTRDAVPQETTDQTDTSLGKDVSCDSCNVRSTKRRLSHGGRVSSELRRSARLTKRART